MATVQMALRSRARDRYDHVFFPVFAALIAVVVFVGFAQTYFLSGVLELPAWKHGMGAPHPWMVEVHGAILSSWVVLFLVQTSLAGAGRVDLHRKLGVAGFVLASLVVLAGLGVVSESIARHFRPGDPRIGGLAVQALWIAGFAVTVLFGFLQRRNPSVHKRLMLISTIMLLPAPLVRWPIVIAGNFGLAKECCYGMLVLLACYDLWSRRRIYAATLWGGAALIVELQIAPLVLVHNALWFRVAEQMQGLGRHLR
jgi:hypothetical protein